MLSIVSHDVIRIFATNIQDTTKVFTLTTDTDFSLQRLFCKALKFDQSVKTASGRFPLQKYKNCAQSGFPHFDAINIERLLPRSKTGTAGVSFHRFLFIFSRSPIRLPPFGYRMTGEGHPQTPEPAYAYPEPASAPHWFALCRSEDVSNP